MKEMEKLEENDDSDYSPSKDYSPRKERSIKSSPVKAGRNQLERCPNVISTVLP